MVFLLICPPVPRFHAPSLFIVIYGDDQSNADKLKLIPQNTSRCYMMLIGSNVSSDFGPLQGAPWSMDPPRPPPNATTLPPAAAMELSPTGKCTITLPILSTMLRYLVTPEIYLVDFVGVRTQREVIGVNIEFRGMNHHNNLSIVQYTII